MGRASAHPSAITLAIAEGLRAGDPACRTAMREPWGWDPAVPYPDQARLFATMLGQYDAVAEANDCPTWQQGHAGLLDMVGFNIYFGHDRPAQLAAAGQLFPTKRVVVAETANSYRPDCHPPALWWAKFEALGGPGLEVCWNPCLTMLTHELGERMHGNLLDEDGATHWQRPRRPLSKPPAAGTSEPAWFAAGEDKPTDCRPLMRRPRKNERLAILPLAAMARLPQASNSASPWQLAPTAGTGVDAQASAGLLGGRRQAAGDAQLQAAQLGQAAQAADGRVAGVGFFGQVVEHLVAVVGAHGQAHLALAH